MNILLFGGASFIGKNLALRLARNKRNTVTLADENKGFFRDLEALHIENICIKTVSFTEEQEFDTLLEGQDIVYHLVSLTGGAGSKQTFLSELTGNAALSARLLDACVRCRVKKVVFISSGGTVYGSQGSCPFHENMGTNPVSAYGLQKVTIEKMLHVYEYMYGLDYRIIRLANPYGPYQRPDGPHGAIAAFTYRAMKKEEIIVFGDGTVVRDFIYIGDAVRAIENIVEGASRYRIFNIGCGYGTSINQVLSVIKEELDVELNITYRSGREGEIPVNYLDISRYEEIYGKLMPVSLQEGVRKTAEYMRGAYGL